MDNTKFDAITDSYLNRQKKQAKEMFLELTAEEQKDFMSQRTEQGNLLLWFFICVLIDELDKEPPVIGSLDEDGDMQ